MKSSASELAPARYEQLVFDACEMYFTSSHGVAIIANQLTQRYQIKITREKVYELLQAGRMGGSLVFMPPREYALAQRIAVRCGVPRERVVVVNVEGTRALEHVANAGADLAFDHFVVPFGQGHDNTRQLHIAMGAGRTSMYVARRMGIKLRSYPGQLPRLVLHALSSGFLPLRAMECPVAFFSHFDHPAIRAEFVGLFTEPLVPSRGFEAVKSHEGAKEAFSNKEKIDIVITSLASRESTTGMLNQVVRKFDKTIVELESKGWVGDVQFNWFSNSGPIKVKGGMQPVTLFTIEELAARAQLPGKATVIIAGPEHDGERTRTKALRPLLTQPSLRVWTHLVLDIRTAIEVLE